MMLERTATLSLDGGTYSLENDEASPTTAVSSETANQITHGLGFVLSLAGATVMLQSVAGQSDRLQSAGCVIYVCSLVALYAASTLSHSFACPRRREFFRMLDQVCIFLLIAGSMTPFAVTHLREGAWWLLPAIMWTLATAGILVRILRGDGAVTWAFYAMIGWMPILTLPCIADLSGPTGVGLVIGGGLAYTGGLWFFVNDDRHPYLHAAWHLCTIAGSTCHFLFLQWYVADWPLVA